MPITSIQAEFSLRVDLAGSQIHGVFLEEGIEWKQVGLPPNDAQFLETRQFQLTEVSRIFRVPPHKISDLNRATYSNVDKQEQQFKHFFYH